MVQDRATRASEDSGKSEVGSPPLAWIKPIWRSLNRLRSGIGLRLLAGVLLFSSAITLLLTGLQLYLDYRRDVGTIERRMSEIEGSYLRSLGEGLWNLDERQLELQVDGILHLPAIRFVEVREATDRPDPLVVTAGSREASAAVHREFPLFHTVHGADSGWASSRSRPPWTRSIASSLTGRSSSSSAGREDVRCLVFSSSLSFTGSSRAISSP